MIDYYTYIYSSIVQNDFFTLLAVLSIHSLLRLRWGQRIICSKQLLLFHPLLNHTELFPVFVSPALHRQCVYKAYYVN